MSGSRIPNADLRSDTLGSQLLGWWIEAAGYQKFLYVVSAVLVLSAGVHTVVLLVTGGSLEGDVSWRKPILFGEAFGLTCLSVAWIMTFLRLRPSVGWLLAGILGLTSTGEVFWVSMQQWRGVSSHFNNSTTFDATTFAAAGGLIFFTGLALVSVTILTFHSLRAPASLAWAIRGGMGLLLASQVFGMAMISNGGNTFGGAGAGKLPHALAMHAPQILPALGIFLMFAKLSEAQRTRIVIQAIVGYTLLVIATASQTFTGVAPSEVGPTLGIVIAASVVAMAVSFLEALVAYFRARKSGREHPA